MGRYVLSDRAQVDLYEIWRYIARDNLTAADNIADELRETFCLLGDQPFMGESCEKLLSAARRFGCGNYQVYYLVEDKRVRVVRVIHAARDVRSLD